MRERGSSHEEDTRAARPRRSEGARAPCIPSNPSPSPAAAFPSSPASPFSSVSSSSSFSSVSSSASSSKIPRSSPSSSSSPTAAPASSLPASPLPRPAVAPVFPPLSLDLRHCAQLLSATSRTQRAWYFVCESGDSLTLRHAVGRTPWSIKDQGSPLFSPSTRRRSLEKDAVGRAESKPRRLQSDPNSPSPPTCAARDVPLAARTR